MTVALASSPSHQLIEGWFASLYRNCEGWVTLFSIDKQSGIRHTDWAPTEQPDELAAIAVDRAASCDVWYGVATRAERLTEGKRGGAKDCLHIPAMWADIDIAGPNHSAADLPPDLAAARRLLSDYPLDPTVTVNSGGGLQPYWLLSEPLEAANASEFLDRWAYTWTVLSERHDWHIDNVWDVARVLRVPGTQNRKHEPIDVTILDLNKGRRYGTDDLDQWVIDPPPRTNGIRPAVPYIGPQRPGDAFNAVTDGAKILESAGFDLERTDSNGDRHYHAPGAANATGATVYADDGHTTIWSETATARWPSLQLRRPYDPFGLYSHLEHRGDWTTASDTLERQGYGKKHVGELPAIAEPRRLLTVEPADTTDGDYLAGLIRERGQRVAFTGGAFVFDQETAVTPLWGEDEAVLWSSGEPLVVAAPTGVGKTTIVQQLILARHGLRDGFLGWPVMEGRRTLYLACDRPRQAQRSLARMVTPAQRSALDEHLMVWKGPLVGDIAKQPDLLVAMASVFDADCIVIDSLKDVTSKITDDEVGGKVNQALQFCCVEGIEVIVLHHQRKAQAGAGKPTSIDDVYGSTWITAGAGSVVLLWGRPGDLVVELLHLKQPVEDVGPLTIVHNHMSGETSLEMAPDLYEVVRTSNGLNTEAVARMFFKTNDPQPNQIEKARRKLEALVRRGVVTAVAGSKSHDGRQLPTRYYALGSEPK